jgi:Na+-transporting NADH:ubiquinone oxidoreductase subunit C
MKAGRVREWARTVGFTFGVTFVFISAVAAIHLVTADRVARNARLYLKRAVLAAAGVPLENGVSVESAYESRVRERRTADATVVYDVRAPGSETPDAYVLLERGPGLWGTIAAAVGLERGLRAFTGIRFVEQNETPGLGARIAEPWFQDQIRGKSGPFDRLVAEGTKTTGPRELEAITGATITTVAVRDLLNRVLATAAGRVAGARLDGEPSGGAAARPEE